MKRIISILIYILVLSSVASAQFNAARAIKGLTKVVQASTLTDAQIEGYVKDFISSSDTQNVVCLADDPYAVRLEKIVGGFNNRDGLNIKAYKAEDVNAFACADGSIRVYTGLMDIMSDEEILGVVGHEIGHIHNKDTKDAFRTALLNSALRDGIASTGQTAAKLSDSQLGNLSESLLSSRYSQKQEYEADNYGYEFLKSNGINPWAMAMSFEKLQKMEQEMGANKSNKVQQLFSTHPDIVARTKRMADKATVEGFSRPQ